MENDDQRSFDTDLEDDSGTSSTSAQLLIGRCDVLQINRTTVFCRDCHSMKSSSRIAATEGLKPSGRSIFHGARTPRPKRKGMINVSLRSRRRSAMPMVTPRLRQRCHSVFAVVQRFDMSCHLLETVVDEQLKATLEDDHVSVISRSLCFNDIRAFATAIEANLESLTLHSVGLTARSVVVLCQGLKKCVHLQLLVTTRQEENIDACYLFDFLGCLVQQDRSTRFRLVD